MGLQRAYITYRGKPRKPGTLHNLNSLKLCVNVPALSRERGKGIEVLLSGITGLLSVVLASNPNFIAHDTHP